MKPFKFELEAVLQYRRRLEQICRQEIARLETKLNIERQMLAMFESILARRQADFGI